MGRFVSRSSAGKHANLFGLGQKSSTEARHYKSVSGLVRQSGQAEGVGVFTGETTARNLQHQLCCWLFKKRNKPLTEREKRSRWNHHREPGASPVHLEYALNTFFMKSPAQGKEKHSFILSHIQQDNMDVFWFLLGVVIVSAAVSDLRGVTGALNEPDTLSSSAHSWNKNSMKCTLYILQPTHPPTADSAHIQCARWGNSSPPPQSDEALITILLKSSFFMKAFPFAALLVIQMTGVIIIINAGI